MKRCAVLICMALLLPASGVYGQLPGLQLPGITYRCVDQAGRSTYTNVGEEMVGRMCVAVSRGIPAGTKPPPLENNVPRLVVSVDNRWLNNENKTYEELEREKAKCTVQMLNLPKAGDSAVFFTACMRVTGWRMVSLPVFEKGASK